MDKVYYKQLTGFRFLAALMVYFSHLNPFEGTHLFVENFFYEMQAGVGLFFVLSGFLITLRYFDNLEMSRRWFAGFMINRFARIYPIFFLLTVLTFFYQYTVKGTFDWAEACINIVLLKAYSGCHLNSGIMQAWSLTVEETFYVLSPLLFFLLKKKLKWTTLFLFQLVGFAIAFAMVVLHKKLYFAAPPYSYCIFFDWDFTFIYTFFGRCTDFLMGMALALVIKNRLSLPKAIINFRGKTSIGALGVACCIAYVASFRNNELHFSGIRLWHGLIENNLVLPVFTALLIWGLITERSWLNKLLSTKLIENLGKSSYVFYLIHIGVFRKILENVIPFETLLLLLLLLIAHLLYVFVEKKLNHSIRTWWFKTA